MHRTALVEYAAPIVGDRARAEDVVQEAYLRFVPSAGDAAPALDQPLAYLYRIVRNLALDLTRRRAMEQRQQTAETLWWMLPPLARTPEQDMLHRRDLARVENVLAGLPARMRQALEMHRLGGHTLGEVAKALNVSVPTAHRLVRDALVAVALHIDPAGEE